MAYFKYKNKNIFYSECGSGNVVLVLLHGNTASSKMFDEIIKLLEKDFKILTLDFLGCGRSDRVKKLNTDLWYDESQQVITLLQILNIDKVNIVGTSGGALVGINIALERPDLVNKIIADSFEGEESINIITDTIVEDRKKSKNDLQARQFYKYMNGNDWEKVIDNDTVAIYEHSKKIKKFYHKDISKLSVPILFTGSKEDEFLSLVGSSFYEDLFNQLMKKVENGSMFVFDSGGHPAMLSNMHQYSNLIKEYILKDKSK